MLKLFFQAHWTANVETRNSMIPFKHQAHSPV